LAFVTVYIGPGPGAGHPTVEEVPFPDSVAPHCRNRTVELWLGSLDLLKELAKLYKAIKE
jgi:hypothetical protein